MQDWADEDSHELKEEWNEQEGVLQFHIPMFEISHHDGQQLLKAKRDEKIYLRVSTTISKSDNMVDVDLWYSSTLDLGLKLSDELAALSYSYHNDHQNKPLFTPRIATFSCLDCAQDFKTENCYSDGRFCSYTPKFFDEYKLRNPDFHFSGRDILL